MSICTACLTRIVPIDKDGLVTDWTTAATWRWLPPVPLTDKRHVCDEPAVSPPGEQAGDKKATP